MIEPQNIDPAKVFDFYPNALPRYTSYPTAPQFKSGVGSSVLETTLENLTEEEPVSIYLHIPFCDRLCWFCGCHTKHTNKYEPIKNYIDSLCDEINLLGRKLNKKVTVSHLHFGGGSPSLIQSKEMRLIKQSLERYFAFDEETEISVEIDPSDATDDFYKAIEALGVTRASIGVQDFDPEVQRLINRTQSFELTEIVVKELRAIGIKSINIDALYGLPKQTNERVESTVQQCISLKPDRMAMFGYAHVPWFKPHQIMIKEEDLPGQNERFEQMENASRLLVQSGYNSIGIDHFALPNDSLSVAQKKGTLRRNFQGYTTDSAEVMLGLGASSIGRSPSGFMQNTVATNLYQKRVAAGVLASDKGYKLQPVDLYRGALIERLMCYFHVDFASLPFASDERVSESVQLANKFSAADPFQLVKVSGTSLYIPPQAKPFARIVASQFDQYLKRSTVRFSKVV
ncbi:oxygen-independent coproporphyrinogen III oxidase [Ahrensia sp. 13_GOM-1096m]|uniref:oxygen-independent coproporphyrinogen III oxidase n=1 Tax=Ahrensia sp. 13_GOM-1096m TaxID=1380380 RepID=UPI000684A3C3|nr:oxygen-independent coproporphyrinogen III oxidase [Ahrensia sp. 13_GOM-1096m]